MLTTPRLVVSILLGFASAAMAIIPVSTGREIGFWEDRAAVVATVEKVETGEHANGARVRLRIDRVIVTDHPVAMALTIRNTLHMGVPMASLEAGKQYVLVLHVNGADWVIQREVFEFFRSEAQFEVTEATQQDAAAIEEKIVAMKAQVARK